MFSRTTVMRNSDVSHFAGKAKLAVIAFTAVWALGQNPSMPVNQVKI